MRRRSVVAGYAAGLLALLLCGGCQQGQPLAVSAGHTPPRAPASPHADTVAPEGWTVQDLPSARTAQPVRVLYRPPLQAPARLRVWVIPGSGCAGMGPVASAYFAGLRQAQVWVLHKPGVDVMARTPPQDCSPAFVAQDALSLWRDDARAALQSAQATLSAQEDTLPQWLVGVSEGGEVAPLVAAQLHNLQGVVVLSSAGLAPAQVAAQQAHRTGHAQVWQDLVQQARSAADDAQVVQGRTLRYWRDVLTWPSAQALHEGPWPLLHVWGAHDAWVPPEAARRFAAAQTTRAAPYCAWEMAQADHGLQGPQGRDGVQQVWARLTQWARQGRLPCNE